jgi:tetratricopeptide (TPR) repeat protein
LEFYRPFLEQNKWPPFFPVRPMTADAPHGATRALSVVDLHRQAVQASEAGAHLEGLRLTEQAIALSPENSSCWNMKGLCLKALGRMPEAQTCYRNGLALKPEDSQIWSNLSILFTDMKHYQSAILCNEKAVAFDPQNAEILFNHAILLCKAQKHAQSLPLFDRALRLAPDSPDILFNRAVAKFYTGDFATGWQDYEARLDIGILQKRKRPGNLWQGQSFAGRLNLGSAFSDAGQSVRWPRDIGMSAGVDAVVRTASGGRSVRCLWPSTGRRGLAYFHVQPSGIVYLRSRVDQRNAVFSSGTRTDRPIGTFLR